MKFHVSIIGHAEARAEIDLVEFLRDMISKYNNGKIANSVCCHLDEYSVSVREDTVN